MHDQDVPFCPPRDRFLNGRRDQPFEEAVVAAADDDQLGVALVCDGEQLVSRRADLPDVVGLDRPGSEPRPCLREPLLRKLRPDVILTQKLCDVCAVGYGTVARLAETLPGPPTVVNLEPSSVSDIFVNIRQVAEVCGVPERAHKLATQLSNRIEAVRRRANRIAHQPRCFLMEWVDPPFCSGHWGPELLEIAGGCDPLGRKHQPSAQIDWQDVLDRKPDVIVLALCGYDVDRTRRDYEILRGYPDFNSLPAARRGEIYLVDASAYFARPGPRIVDSLEILAGILHPGEFPEFTSHGPDDPRVVRAG